jgi:hypothetical protein
VNLSLDPSKFACDAGGPCATLDTGVPSEPCPEFEANVVPLLTTEPNSSVVYLLPDGDSAAWVGSSSSRDHLYHVAATGSVAEIRVQQGPWLGAMLGQAGEMYLGTRGGQIYRGRVRGSTVAVQLYASAPSKEQIHWLDGTLAADGSLISLYTLSLEGTLEHFDGRAWERLFVFMDRADSPVAWSGALVALGPDEAIAGRAVLEGQVVHVRGATAQLETTPDGIEGFSSAAIVPGLGTVIGDLRGFFFSSSGQGWSALPSSGYGLEVDSIVPYGDGFAYAGAMGFAGTYVASRSGIPFCAPMMFAPDTVNHIVRAGSALYLGGQQPVANAKLTVTILHRR